MKNLLKLACLFTLSIAIASCGGGGSSSGSSSADAGKAPSAPNNVTVTVNATGTWIMWDKVTTRINAMMDMGEDMGENDGSGITYTIYLAAQPNVKKDNWNTLEEGMKMINVTSPHQCSQLSKGTNYYAVVTASNEYGTSAESSEVSFTPETDS
ncbi:hypothetical protein MNBD_NITROSPINAE02-537 [hydrothermal vent metagenome]|uniref:Fibronectin type-III domain-containing protein n=1 Tax=hydrothermal vent metagenome TaxID=652676 RepID=A0A3B1CM43_9ZZZZ